MTENAPLMTGKKGLVMGVANERSIAWGITRALSDHGANIGLTYQNSVLEKRVRPLAEKLNCDLLIECDVSDESSIARTMKEIEEKWVQNNFHISTNFKSY